MLPPFKKKNMKTCTHHHIYPGHPYLSKSTLHSFLNLLTRSDPSIKFNVLLYRSFPHYDRDQRWRSNHPLELPGKMSSKTTQPAKKVRLLCLVTGCMNPNDAKILTFYSNVNDSKPFFCQEPAHQPWNSSWATIKIGWVASGPVRISSWSLAIRWVSCKQQIFTLGRWWS